MNTRDKQSDHPETDLRSRAETAWFEKPTLSSEEIASLSTEATRAMLHELQVHQIELEMQNEELRRTQEELETSRARYFELYDLAPVGYCTLSENGLIHEANLTLANKLGVMRGSLVKIPFSRLVFRDDQDTFYLLRKRLTAHGDPRTCELRLAPPGGEPFWVQLEVTGGPVLRIALTDINERKKIEKELNDHRFHLEELVSERTEQLNRSQHLAEAANLAKSAFLANMSHEIRTPMNAIIGLTHILQSSETMPGQSDQLAKINVAAEHLLAVINDVLDVSKIEAGRLELEHVNFSLVTVLEDVESLFKGQADSKGLSIHVEAGEISEWLLGDATRLRQCLLNYIGNAIKFTKKGTVTIRVRQLQGKADGVFLRFEVQDTGIGIVADKLPGLFRPFVQGDTSTTRRFGGSGLGLIITRHLAELMGGTAGVESEFGKGSTFWFTACFDHGEPIQAQETTAGEQPVFDYASRRILLVEDNTINLEVCAVLLKRVGLLIDMAENGREAVKMVSAGAYDLILMDVQMPEMDGLEATRLIRAMDGCMAGSDVRYRDIPILAMTANAYEEDRQACMRAGMNDFITKPVDPINLYYKIANWLPKKTDT